MKKDLFISRDNQKGGYAITFHNVGEFLLRGYVKHDSFKTVADVIREEKPNHVIISDEHICKAFWGEFQSEIETTENEVDKKAKMYNMRWKKCH